MRVGRILPLLLFLLAAAGTGVLGARIVAAESAAAELAAREGLRVSLKVGEAALREQAVRLLGEVVSGKADAVIGPDGAILHPPPPRPLERLGPSSDPQAAFFLQEGERAETVDGDAERAMGLYRTAAGDGRDSLARPMALYRMAALLRRTGDAPAAEAAEAEFLESLPEGSEGTLEALLVLARRQPPDPELPGRLAIHLDADPGSNPVLEGIRRLAGVPQEVFRERRAALSLRAGLEGFARRPPSGPGGITFLPADDPLSILAAVDARIAAWQRAGDGTLKMRIEPAADPPHGVFHLEGESRWNHVIGDVVRPLRGDLRETLEPSIPEWTPDPAFPFHLAATASRDAVAAAARRSALMLGALLAALLLAGASAFVLSLRAARRETEAARARADFVTKVGHDLRTPLSVIRMYAETLAAGRVADPGEARAFAGVAAREAERLTAMVGQVLDLSRVAGGPSALQRRPEDLAVLAEEVAAWHRPLLERAGLRLETRIAGPLPVLADAAALRGAVSNLLENAARHAASGGTVEVEAAPAGRMAVVRILDRGPGLPPGPGPRLFERFVRGPGAAGPGAGLGLALVREAAEAHGGGASAADREGGGAIFDLRIPLEEGTA